MAILSAKYGLLSLEDQIETYNLRLNDMGVEARRGWSEKVFKQMQDRLNLSVYDCFLSCWQKLQRIFNSHVKESRIGHRDAIR